MDLLKRFSNIFKTRKSDVKLSWHFKYNVVYKQAYELILCCIYVVTLLTASEKCNRLYIFS